MATFDMTSSATAGVNSNSIAALPASRNGLNMRITLFPYTTLFRSDRKSVV